MENKNKTGRTFWDWLSELDEETVVVLVIVSLLILGPTTIEIIKILKK